MPDDTNEQGPTRNSIERAEDRALSRRNILLGSSALVAAATMTSGALAQAQKAAPAAQRRRSVRTQAEYPRHLGRRHRHRQHQRLLATA